MSRPLPRTHIIYTIAVVGFIYTLHLVIPMYSNSSFLSLFADERTLGYIYMLGAAVTVLGFLVAPAVIRRFGNYAVAVALVCAQICLFYGLIAITSPLWLSVVFILQTAVVALIGLCLDIFLEVYTSTSEVGAVRGLYTATLNASWVVGPLIGSMLINGTESYRNTYVAALAMLFPLLYLIYRNFPRFKDPNYIHLSPLQLVKHVSGNPNWVRLFSANLLLQTFYAWMTIYTPIYLHTVVGFGWDQIGIILVVMLLPFPIVQYPLGRLADKKYGEKEIMAIGFAILGIGTIALALITSNSLLVWAMALFVTRIGAASAEIMMEIYFFKTVSPRDSAVLGSFRITRPMSYFLAPLVTGIGLAFTANEYLFAVVGVITLVAIYPVLQIRDTN